MNTCEDCGQEIEDGIMAYINHHYECPVKIESSKKPIELNNKPRTIFLYMGQDSHKKFSELLITVFNK